MKNTTLKKLKNYGTMSAAFLATTPLALDAAPIYHNPGDIVLTTSPVGANDTVFIDMDGGTMSNSNFAGADFRIAMSSSNLATFPPYANWANITPIGVGNDVSSGPSLPSGIPNWCNVPMLASGGSVSAGGNFNFVAASLDCNNVIAGYNVGLHQGNWPNPSGLNYIGVALDIAGATHYGWIRIDLEYTVHDNYRLTVYDFAYEGVAGAPLPIGGSTITQPTVSNVDADGDGIPDITDPCDCFDSQNLYVAADISFFHDFIRIESGPGEVWEISNYNAGSLHSSSGGVLPFGTVIPEVTPGVYYLDVWHQDAIGFDADFERAIPNLSLNISNTCFNAACPSGVPTLSQWGIISLSLFLLSFGSIVLVRKGEYSFASKEVNMTVKSIFQRPPFDLSIFKKAMVFTALLASIMAVLTWIIYGSIATVDVLGTAVAGPIFAYLMHLLMLVNNQKED